MASYVARTGNNAPNGAFIPCLQNFGDVKLPLNNWNLVEPEGTRQTKSAVRRNDP